MTQADNVSLLMAATALPTSSDTFFASISAGDLPLKAFQYGKVAQQQLSSLVGSVSVQDMFLKMVNEGNLLDIRAEYDRQKEQGPREQKWMQVAERVLSIQSMESFHVKRALILASQTDDSQSLIQQSKDDIIQMSGISIPRDNLNWDALASKIVPNVSDYFIALNPHLVQSLGPSELAVLDTAEKLIWETVTEKCAEFRQRTNSVEDEFFPDTSMYFETNQANIDDLSRTTRIKGINRNLLIRYVDNMQVAFSSGHIPGSISPAKIYACHDIVSLTELRGAIQKLSDDQLTHPADLISNPIWNNAAIKSGMEDRTISDAFSVKQRAGISLAKRVDQRTEQLNRAMNEKNSYAPPRMLENQLAGGSNRLDDQVDFWQSGGVVTMNNEQKTQLTYQLSILLACLRIRCDAVQSSQCELVGNEDFDHLEIVRQLAQEGGIDVLDELYRTASATLAMYKDGHNVSKLEGKQIPVELTELINYTVNGRLRMIIKGITLFDEDMQQNGSNLFQSLLTGIMKVCLMKNRIENEYKERLVRRKALGSVYTQY